MSTAAAIAQKTCPRCGATYDLDALFCAKDGTKLEPEDTDIAPDSDPYIGTVISGDIEILSVAGVGAMGRVYRAHQRGIDRNVAVKILHRELSGNTQLVARFHREAKIASRLQHPHVVEVYLAGQLHDRALYIAMEYLDGMSLAAALAAAGGVFHPGRALSIALQICDAVGEGHTRGIVHRDLKPENVMLVRRAEMGDWVKVLDFGIAKVTLGDQSMQTAAGLVFGTARYISPEGAQGANVGPPGDVYSLATMIYQMLAGRTPFDAEPVGLLIKHIHEPPPLLTAWPRSADIHPALVKVVMDNLAKDPARRAASARVFASQLAAAAREANIAISEVGIIARLSNVDLEHARVLEPTLDDASGLLGLNRTPSNPLPASIASSGNAVVLTPGLPASADPSPSLAYPPPSVQHTAPLVTQPTPVPAEPPAPSQRRPSRFVVIMLTLLLGAALAGLTVQLAMRHSSMEHEAHVAKTRAALTDGRYVTPPGDCVRDLTVQGLKRWPNDLDLLQLRSTASMELVTRAMVAHNGGDASGARDLARDATQVDPTDHSAALLLSHYDDEIRQLGADAGTTTGKPRVLFEPLPLTHAGERVELSALVTPGAGGATKITRARMTLFEHTTTTGGIAIPVTTVGQGVFHATLTAPKPGNYDVVFEASIEGPNLRAARELTVVE